jgi:addiction module HigA family antidote
VIAMPAMTLRAPNGVPTRQPAHPGRFLARHYLGPLAISQSRAARLLCVSRRRMHELTQGQRAMSPDTAIRCAMAFGVRADFWLSLQSNWDCFQAWRALRHTAAAGSIAAVQPAPHF